MELDTHHTTQGTGQQLREARLAAHLSLRELASRAGTSHATLSAYESGRKIPAITTYLRLLEAAGYAVDFHISKRIREQDGIPRGEELAAVLRLAEQFPARVSRQMDFPVFPSTRRH